MPFEGATVPAPIMAAKQGMMDAALHGVSDQQKSVVRYVAGALTGKGSGLLQPSTQSNQSGTQANQTLTQQAGQAMQLGAGGAGGDASPDGGGAMAGMFSGGGSSSLVGAMASLPGGGGMAGLASAQSMMQQGSGALGSAAALAGSSALSGLSAGGMGSSSASAGASAMSALSSSPALASGLAPGTSPTAPQFTALPNIPSLPRLSDVIAKLGAMVGGSAGSALSSVINDGASGGGDDVGSGMEQEPTQQLSGQGQAADYEADS